MPRCRNAAWCIDDLCHATDQTMCGLWYGTDLAWSGEWLDDDDDEWGDEYDDEEPRVIESIPAPPDEWLGI